MILITWNVSLRGNIVEDPASSLKNISLRNASETHDCFRHLVHCPLWWFQGLYSFLWLPKELITLCGEQPCRLVTFTLGWSEVCCQSKKVISLGSQRIILHDLWYFVHACGIYLRIGDWLASMWAFSDSSYFHSWSLSLSSL